MKLFFGHRDLTYEPKFDYSRRRFVGNIWRFTTDLLEQIGYKIQTPDIGYIKL